MAYRQENRDIIIDGWENGISNNPYEGLADMRCVDPVTVPGEVSIAPACESYTNTQGEIYNVAFTANKDTNVFTYDGVVPLEINTAVYFTGADLPNGLTAATAYYVITTPTPTTFTVSAISAGGAVKTFSDNGTGTMTFSAIRMGVPVASERGSIYFSAANYTNWIYFILDSKTRLWYYDEISASPTNKWVYVNNAYAGYEGSSWLDTFGGEQQGLIFWKNCLFFFNSITGISAMMSPLDNTNMLAHFTTRTNWNFNWKIPTGALNTARQFFVGQDDIVYFCNGRKIGAIDEIDGSIFNLASTHTNATGVTTINSKSISTVTDFFQNTDIGALITGTGIAAGTRIASVTDATHATLDTNATANGTGITFTITTTYTYNESALLLPSYEMSNCIGELGQKLLIGGLNNYVYPWDRLSVTFDYPIFLSENVVSKIITVNTTAYLFAGFNGRIYQTNGTNANIYWTIPSNLSKTVNPYFFWKCAMFSRNQLYFGFSATTNSGDTINEYGGLWAIDLDTGRARLSNEVHTNDYSGYVGAILINRKSSVLLPPSDDGYGLFIAFTDGTSDNKGLIGNVAITVSDPYISGEPYIDTDLIPVGQFLTKKTYENIEYKLSTPLVTGESVALYYRTDINGTFTNIPITQGGQVGDVSGIGVVNFENIQWLQIKIVLNGVLLTPSYVRLKEIRIR